MAPKIGIKKSIDKRNLKIMHFLVLQDKKNNYIYQFHHNINVYTADNETLILKLILKNKPNELRN